MSSQNLSHLRFQVACFIFDRADPCFGCVDPTLQLRRNRIQVGMCWPLKRVGKQGIQCLQQEQQRRHCVDSIATKRLRDGISDCEVETLGHSLDARRDVIGELDVGLFSNPVRKRVNQGDDIIPTHSDYVPAKCLVELPLFRYVLY
ncbi:hypothetical protein DF032_16165 [Burkholderia seminalis]|nr:hypothetical protein DF032_16165 [Burkholderia seminalis]